MANNMKSLSADMIQQVNTNTNTAMIKSQDVSVFLFLLTRKGLIIHFFQGQANKSVHRG